MQVRLVARSVAAAIVLALAASPSSAYIHFPPTTLPAMCKMSTNIRELSVQKHDRDKGIIIFELADTLKGDAKTKLSFRHSIGKKADGTKPIFDWLADGKKAVMFTIEWKEFACGYVFIDEFCYSVDYNAKGEYWLLIRVDPELSATYHGTAEKLKDVTKDLLAGKDMKVPVKESMKPLTIKEREKIFNAVNDKIVKNREK